MSKGKNDQFNEFGRFLREKRGNRNQEDVSRLARLSVPYISQLESGFLINRKYNDHLKRLTKEIEREQSRAHKVIPPPTTLPQTDVAEMSFDEAIDRIQIGTETEFLDELMELERGFGNAEGAFNVEERVPQVFLEVPEETLTSLAYAYDTSLETLREYLKKGNRLAHEALMRQCRSMISGGSDFLEIEETIAHIGPAEQGDSSVIAPTGRGDREGEEDFLLQRAFDDDREKLMKLSVRDILYIKDALNQPTRLRSILSSLGLTNYANSVGKAKGTIENALREIALKLLN